MRYCSLGEPSDSQASLLFGEKKVGDYLQQIPIKDKNEIDLFKKDFGIKRSNASGTSWVIPGIKDEFNVDNVSIISDIDKNISKLPIIQSEIKEIKIHYETNKILNHAIFLADKNNDELVRDASLYMIFHRVMVHCNPNLTCQLI